MAVDVEQRGKGYPAHSYVVGREKIREYARAVGDENPVYLDPAAAKQSGFSALVAPPMFAVVYQRDALIQPILDPELGINLALMVHGEQEFEWQSPVVAGDEITTQVTVEDVYDKKGMDFVVLKAESVNQRGEPTVTGRATLVVRRG